MLFEKSIQRLVVTFSKTIAAARSQISWLFGPTLSQPITCLSFSCDRLAYKWVCLRNFVTHWLSHRLQTIRKKKQRMNERVTQIPPQKMKNVLYMLVALSSPVQFSKTVFLVWSLKLYYKNILSVVSNHLKSWVAESEEILEVYSTETRSNITTIREHGKLD